jgi:hypothetical protein
LPIPIIPELVRLRQEDHLFKTNLGYISRPVSEKQEKSLAI